jgi:hypothetical protein
MWFAAAFGEKAVTLQKNFQMRGWRPAVALVMVACCLAGAPATTGELQRK